MTFELHDRNLGKLGITAEIVGVEDGFDVMQTVAGEGCDLGNCCIG